MLTMCVPGANSWNRITSSLSSMASDTVVTDITNRLDVYVCWSAFGCDMRHVGDGVCNPECDVPYCQQDGGDCRAPLPQYNCPVDPTSPSLECGGKGDCWFNWETGGYSCQCYDPQCQSPSCQGCLPAPGPCKYEYCSFHSHELFTSAYIYEWNGVMDSGESAMAPDRETGFAFSTPARRLPLNPDTSNNATGLLYLTCAAELGVSLFNEKLGFAASAPNAAALLEFLAATAEQIEQCRASDDDPLSDQDFRVRFGAVLCAVFCVCVC